MPKPEAPSILRDLTYKFSTVLEPDEKTTKTIRLSTENDKYLDDLEIKYRLGKGAILHAVFELGKKALNSSLNN
tara:strand:+ start:18907 stop:19128 length:222 start_codon:yes stop_codon:yes gene_type:complete